MITNWNQIEAQAKQFSKNWKSINRSGNNSLNFSIDFFKIYGIPPDQVVGFKEMSLDNNEFGFLWKGVALFKTTNDKTLEYHENDLYMIDDIFCVIDPSGTANLFDGIEYTLFDLQHLTPTELQKKYGSELDNIDLDEIFYELLDCVKETLYEEITMKYGVEIGGDVYIEEGKSQDFQSGLN